MPPMTRVEIKRHYQTKIKHQVYLEILGEMRCDVTPSNLICILHASRTIRAILPQGCGGGTTFPEKVS